MSLGVFSADEIHYLSSMSMSPACSPYHKPWNASGARLPSGRPCVCPCTNDEQLRSAVYGGVQQSRPVSEAARPETTAREAQSCDAGV